jgi:hypothetical protein
LGDLHKKMASGNLITIPKEPKRDRSSTKSYRPNCLLSMVGELLERLMAARISTLSHHLELNADRQYGFRPGGSKTNAIVQLKEKGGQMSDKKYVFAIAHDISCTVDHVWWPNVVHEVTRRVCPDNLCRLRRKYFTDSTLHIVGKYEVIAKPVTKGFPQESVMCPSFWDLIFDDLLDDLRTYTTECEPVANADVIIILIARNDRTELQKTGQEAVMSVSNCCSPNKSIIVGGKNRNAPAERKIGLGKASNYQNKWKKNSKATSDKLRRSALRESSKH